PRPRGGPRMFTAQASMTPQLHALDTADATAPTVLAAWRALGEALMESGQPADAANAFGRAVALGDKDPKLQSRLGAALVLAGGEHVDDKAKAAFTAALAGDPTDPIARFFLGLAKEQSGDAAGALTDWLALENDIPADLPWKADLAANIDRVARHLGKDPSKLPGRKV